MFVSRAPPDGNGKGVDRRAAQHLAALRQLGSVTLLLPGASADEMEERGARLASLPLERVIVRREPTHYDVSAMRYWRARNRLARGWFRLRQRYWVDQRALKQDAEAYRAQIGVGFDLLFAYRMSSAVWASSVFGNCAPAQAQVVDFDDIESVAYARIQREVSQTSVERLETWRDIGWLKRTEARLARSWDRVIVCSQNDHDNLAERFGVNALVVPNAAPFASFEPQADAAPALVLFVGTMSYLPNVKGILWFVREVWPKIFAQEAGRITLTIAGIAPPEEISRLNGLSGVQVTGFVRDLKPLYSRATVVIVPIFAGGGTRIKIIEAMAQSRAVVTTPIGCEGLGLEPGREALVEDTAAGFAEAVLRLVRDPLLRGEIAEAGWRFGRDRFASDAVQAKLAGTLEEMLGGQRL